MDEALSDYVEKTYPDDIMLSTYEEDGTSRFDEITKEISPLTAYCLGLADTCPELAEFPALATVTPGVFRQKAADAVPTAAPWPDAVAL